MKRTAMVLALALPLAVASGVARAQSGDCQGSTGGGQVLGTLLGAAVGGLLGSQVGGGTGNKVAIGAGVLAGGLLGNQVGKSMDCKDRAYHQDTAQNALETSSAGATSSWRNPDSGHEGSVTPNRTYQRDDGTYCRDFTQTITVEGRTEEATGTACRQDDGTWRVVSG